MMDPLIDHPTILIENLVGGDWNMNFIVIHSGKMMDW